MVIRRTICFYLDNSSIPNADFENIEAGNPGVGGTQYYCVAVPYYINKFINEEFDVVLYAHSTARLPRSLKTVSVKCILEAYIDASKNKFDFFVFRPLFTDKYTELYKNELGGPKLIAWGHNRLTNSEYSYLYGSKKLVHYLCVSRDQYDTLIDHPLYGISSFIENPFDCSSFNNTSSEKKNNVVTYIGSIVPSKGFHKLARMWPAILKSVPDAKLMVIGNGGLYDENSELGKWGVATEAYEMRFRKYLSDEHGRPLQSVRFLGKLGIEKVEILKMSKVGVPNPTGRTENCPGSVLEFAATGVPVVTAKRNGMLDTVINGQTGYLSNRSKVLVDRIVELLNDDEKRKKLGCTAEHFVRKKFDPLTIIQRWGLLLRKLESGQHVPAVKPAPGSYTIVKRTRVINAFLRKRIPFVPSFLYYEERAKMMLNLMHVLRPKK